VGEIFERVWPLDALDWTGERLTTCVSGQVDIEHLHRYFLARELCRGLDVLDVASGEGYGSALLAQTAKSVAGVEISEQAFNHAVATHTLPNLRYLMGDARQLPIEDSSVDAVVSFETIEHFFEHDRFIAEVRRVLRPGGRLILSSPERNVYSPLGSSANPYHAHELSRSEFEALLQPSFRHIAMILQRPMIGSALVVDGGAGQQRMLTFEKRGDYRYEASRGLPRPLYLIAIASDELLGNVPNSLFIETSEVGDTLGRAAIVSATLQRAETAEAANATIQAERAELRASPAEKEAASVTNDAALHQTIAELRASLASACGQRDALRRALKRLTSSYNERAFSSSERALAAGERALAAGERALAAEAEAAAWQQRYFGLRGRLEAILLRFGIVQVARLTPRRLRLFVKERLLRSGRRN
jgi:SAM-dependent methyltransferase